ncbi:MAG: DUF2029 domain-containing protein [Pirellula sp.]|jgi:hypothetical protein|nr:DUF2029 domain-containing protein [Pirellula sp.]
MSLSKLFHDTKAILLVILVIFVSYLALAPNYRWSSTFDETPYAADFLQEWVGARMIASGQADQLYSEQFILNQHDPSYVGFAWSPEEYFPAVYPPPHYMLFSPLGLIPYRWAGIVWLLCQLLFVYCTWVAARSLIEREPTTTHENSHHGRALWLALILFPALLFSITLGQKSTLWMMIIAVAMSLLASGKDFRAGMVFGFLSIKPTLFFLIPLAMFRQKRWQFLGGSLLSASAIWGLTLMLMPWSVWGGFLDVARGVGSFAENNGYRADWSCNLLTLAYSLSSNLVAWGKVAICIPLAIYVLYSVLIHTPSFDKPTSWLMMLAGTALLSPHFYYYDLCVLLPSLIWLWAKSSQESVAIYVLLAVGCAVSASIYDLLAIPILPIALIGIVSASALRTRWNGLMPPSSARLEKEAILSP